MSLGKVLSLNQGGVKVPQVGFGTWQAKPGEVEKAVTEALKVGYRHIDAALVYRNQNEVGQGIKEAGVPREEITIVSKLWNNSHRPENVEADLDLTLSQLGTDYLDLYLMHWPVPFKPGKDLFPKGDDGFVGIDWDGPSISDTWKEMVRVQKETKKARAVGVSNFTVAQLEKIIKDTGVTPAANQIECHPQLIQPELFKFCKDHNILITCYSPLGNNVTGKPRVIDSQVVQDIAKRLNKDPAQVLIAWATKQGFAVIPKSVTPSRIESNFQTFELSDDDFKALNDYGEKNRIRANIPAEYDPKWNIDIFGEKVEQQYKKVW